MTYYRLLRDNKETGPFSEEEMIAKGFKAYDLIWVEGRSAGWRYPSEIPAFKTFAPVVEEQPYDRFYKKQPPQKHFAEERLARTSYTASDDTVKPVQMPLVNKKPAPEYNIKPMPGRNVHVTLPSGNTVNLSTLVKKELQEPIAARSTEVKAATPIAATAITETPAAAPVNDRPAAIGSFDFRDFDEADTSAKTMQAPQASTSSSFSWSLVAAACIGIATLVGLGIMIGLNISRPVPDLTYHDSHKQQSAPANTTASIPVSAPASSNNLPVENSGILETNKPSTDRNKELIHTAVEKNAVLPAETGNRDEKKAGTDKPVTDISKPVLKTEEVVAHVKPLLTLVNIEKDLSLSQNKFKTGAFGGISDLKCTLVNGSRVPLESVEVEIDYIQANNKVYKTEKVLFSNIAAGAQVTSEAPASNRGIKVSSRIIKVNAKDGVLYNTTAKS